MELVGKRFQSNLCGFFNVLEKIPHPKEARHLCEFDEVMGIKYRAITLKKHITSGGIKNPYYPLKLSVACVGNVNSKNYPKEFNKWRAMIERCYDPKNNHYGTYGAKGIKVCDRWLCFEFFLEDLPRLEGYSKEKLQNGDLDLDKDIRGNRKLYSFENCMLISPVKNVKEMNQRVKQSVLKATRLSDGYVEIFDNQAEFAKKLNVNQSNISKCLNGQQKSVCGYKIELYTEGF